MRHHERVRAIVLVNPFYRLDQLPWILRRTYRRPTLNALFIGLTPEWVFRGVVNFTNAVLGQNGDSDLALPEHVRNQTALDYKRTDPGAFNLPNTVRDLTLSLSLVPQPTLLLWGDRDQTLSPDSFPSLLRALPNARGCPIPGGHVPHQSNPAEFNRLVLEFLTSI
ncbi:MAG: alpha/beta hydrolase, partial [Chloroflexota bacterium]